MRSERQSQHREHSIILLWRVQHLLLNCNIVNLGAFSSFSSIFFSLACLKNNEVTTPAQNKSKQNFAFHVAI